VDDFASQAWARGKQPLDVATGSPNAVTPTAFRRGGRGGLQLQQVLDRGSDMAGKRSAFGGTQTFDLVGHVFPVDCRVRSLLGRRTQRLGLFFGP